MGEWPALVIGSGLSALGAIRLLGKAGIPTYCFGVPQVESSSRWYRPAPGIDMAAARPERLAAYLAECPFERAALLPASDAAVRAIGGLPANLARRFPASLAPSAVSSQLTDKALFAEMLVRLGVPGPRTVRIDQVDDLTRLPDSAFVGAFLKPTDSASYMARFGVKGSLVASREDAIAKADRALSEGHRLVLQEYIPNTAGTGETSARADHVLIDGFVDRNGRVTAMFARRRLRMYVLDFGNSTCMVSVPVAEVQEAADRLAYIAGELGCRGIVSGEFKQDPRDGVYKLLEINSRIWWFVEFAGRCGVDLCTMSYRDALGLPIEPITSYKVGAKFVHAYYDYHAIRALHRTGQLGLLPAAWSWLGAQEPWFNWTDPMPAIRDIMLHVRARRRRAVETPRTA
jgi:D-aspartate ligase